MSNASDDFPDPETPVSTVSWRCGMSTETFLRLWVLAPRIAIVREGIFEGRTFRDRLVIPLAARLQPYAVPLIKIVLAEARAEFVGDVGGD